MEATTTNPLVFYLERQWRPRGKFESTLLRMTRASAIERFRWCVARARGEGGFNRTTNAMRLVDADGNVIESVDLGEERRAAAGKKLERMGGLDGVLDAELRRAGVGGVRGVVLDVRC